MANPGPVHDHLTPLPAAARSVVHSNFRQPFMKIEIVADLYVALQVHAREIAPRLHGSCTGNAAAPRRHPPVPNRAQILRNSLPSETAWATRDSGALSFYRAYFRPRMVKRHESQNASETQRALVIPHARTGPDSTPGTPA